MKEKILERYLKIKALAEQGEAGEKEAAVRRLRQFEVKYEGVAVEAAAYQRRKLGPAPTPPSSSPSSNKPVGRGMGGNWENIFRFASMAYQTFSNVAETVSAANYGTSVAEKEVEVEGYSRKDSLFVRFRLPVSVLPTLRSMNALQKEAFRQTLHNRLEEYLDALVET